MNTRAPDFAGFDGLGHSQLLAGQLRRSRLTLLCAQAGSSTSALLQAGVLPLLRRRSGDQTASQGGDRRSALQRLERRPERRRGAGGSATLRTSEIAIVVDDWGDAPLSRVLERLRAAVPASVATTLAGVPRLAEALTAASQQLSARFLFIFDRFEDSLTGPADRDGVDRFAEEFVGVVNNPALPVHFLLAVHEDAEPLLERFQGRISGFGTQMLRLPSEPATAPEPAAAVGSTVRREDVYRLISTTLSRSVAHQAIEPWVPPPGTVLPADEPAKPAAPIETAAPPPTPTAPSTAPVAAPMPRSMAAPAAAPVAQQVTPPHAAGIKPWLGPKTRRPHLRMLAWVAGVWMLVLAVAAIFFMPGPETALTAEAPPPTPALITPVPMAAPSPPPLTPDFNDELAGLFGADLRTGGPAEGLAFEPGSPPLAIVHYDALLAARGKASATALHIVAPLALDDIVFVARTDAPLTFIHEVEGHRIDAGPADGARALTAGNVYRRLFGKAALLDEAGPRSDELALLRLAEGVPGGASGSAVGGNDKNADVVLVVGAPTLRRWAAAHTDAMRRLKLLMLDRDHPASRKALQAYLPTTLKATDIGGAAPRDTPTLAAMSFLVTSARIDEADGARIESLARTLCERLPQLQARGDPQWRDVALQEQLPAPWPYSPHAARAFAACAATPAVPPSQPRKQPTQGSRP